MKKTETVEFEIMKARRFEIGVIRLNRPGALNSLNLEMIEAIVRQLSEWQTDPEIALVVLHSDLQKAFCAGGDVKVIAQRLLASSADLYARRFFTWEYKMDYMIHTYPKPVLSWGDGIIMGGGLGVFRGSSHRVVTEKSSLAMPEIAIGLFPDVGASYFLNQLADGVGLFLGWTGARLNAADGIRLGFATHSLPTSSKAEVWSVLRAQDWEAASEANHEKLTKVLETFRIPPWEPSRLESHEARIRTAFSKPTASEVRAAFLEISETDPWWQACRRTFLAGSPLSAHVAFEQLRRARGQTLLEAFVMEWNLAQRMSERPEFLEGVRALLIDKDNQPRWAPPRFEDVRREQVEAHFTPFPGAGAVREFLISSDMGKIPEFLS